MLQNYAGLIKQIENTKDAQARDSLIAVYFTHYKLDHPKYYERNVLGFIQNNPDEPASLLELEKYASRSDKDLSSLSVLYNNLTESLKQLPTGKRVYNMIDQDFFSTSLIGKQAPSFMQQDTLGQTWSMDQFKGSVMLLEFWASWCGPCRSSNKNLVKMYRKYKEMGLKIVSISLDSDRTNWLKAVKDDGLDWANLSDLKGFKNEAATIYHINAIPSNYLIDKSGKVVAVNLDEKQLDAQLERLLK